MHKLSIVIPTYNEEKTIQAILKKVERAPLPEGLDKEIIIVDDNSTDQTLAKIKELGKTYKIFSHTKNQGKGGAVKTGFKYATGDFLIIQDADLEYDPNDYRAMVQPILEGRALVTNGVRISPQKDARKKKSLYWEAWLGNHLITWTTNLLYFHNAGEYEGCYKAFTKKLIDSIEVKTNNFDFDNELICKILKRGIKPIDVPIHYYPRSYDDGKKINWRHGFIILWTIIKTRFIN